VCHQVPAYFVAVEKLCASGSTIPISHGSMVQRDLDADLVAEFVFCRGRCCKKSYKTLQVLSSSGHKELLADMPQPPQSSTPETDAILQLAEECLNLLSAALVAKIIWLLISLTRSLSHFLVDMNNKLFISTGSAFCFSQTVAALHFC